MNRFKYTPTRLRDRLGEEPMFSGDAPSRGVAGYDYSRENLVHHVGSRPHLNHAYGSGLSGVLVVHLSGDASSVVFRINSGRRAPHRAMEDAPVGLSVL